MDICDFVVSLIGTLIAAATFGFAIYKLWRKNKDIERERAGQLYSKYLCICQKVEIYKSSIEQLSNDISTYNKEELEGYATAHLITDDVLKCVQEIKELAVPCFKSKYKQEDRIKVKTSLEFCATLETVIFSINSFYQSIISGATYTSDAIKEKYSRINDSFQSIMTSKECSDRNNKCVKCKTFEELILDALEKSE